MRNSFPTFKAAFSGFERNPTTGTRTASMTMRIRAKIFMTTTMLMMTLIMIIM